MEHVITWGNPHMEFEFSYAEDKPVRMSGLRVPGVDFRWESNLPIAEILLSGTGHWIANDRLTHTTVGRDCRYAGHEVLRDEARKMDRLVITERCADPELEVKVTYEIPCETEACFRVHVDVTNLGAAPVSVESVTSWVSELGSPRGRTPDIAAWHLLEGEYEWLGEGRWHDTPVRELLPVLNQELTRHDPRASHSVVSTGTWSTGRHVPLAVLDSREFNATWLFQIEQNGPWRWELGNNTHDASIALAGPTNLDHSWHVTLHPGESFASVAASATLAPTFRKAVGNLTAYRRAMHVEHPENAKPHVIFNDYMNTIDGDPTTEKLLPLIAAAADVGCEIFVIDCGWYDDSGDWWPSVGEWLPSKTRFPGPKGMMEVIDAIRDHGMIPGLWLEPEVVGVKSPMADRLPDSAFFQRNGHRLVEQERYILDLRDPAARAHLDKVVDRLVDQYGVGYFKLDYNVSPDNGTDYAADSAGDGLLRHTRAYVDWIDGIRARHPEVILENCSSGGMREDFVQTSHFQVQSTSDQQDYRIYPTIAATAPMMMLPEQAASWAYPQSWMTDEQTAFNINTTFLGHFFLSGYINRMSGAQLDVIRAGIQAYKDEIQPVIAGGVPFWPLGLPGWNDPVVALGMDADERSYVTVWGRDADEAARDVTLRLPAYEGRDIDVTPVFPVGEGFETWPTAWDGERGDLHVRVPSGGYVSRTFRISRKGGA